jgi:maleate isomerase
MADEIKARVAFISCGPGSRPHYAHLPALFPKDVRVDFKGLELYGDSLYEIEGKKDSILRGVRDLQNECAWDGIMLTAAPPEVLNPGLFEDLKSSLKIPVTTALHACVAALRAYGARRVVLLTPFDDRLNRLICEHLAKAGISASAPHPFQQLGDAMRLKPEEVFELTRKNLSAAGNVDAVYFQGAVLDPIKVVEKIERELHTNVIASNPAMLWFILSRLGLTYHIPGYGKLLEDWPKLDEAD